MRISFLAVLALSTLLTLSAQAQQSASPQPENAPGLPGNASRWSIGLTAGPAFPVGKFVNPQDPNVATVHAGGSVEINGAYRLCHVFSATMVLQGQLNNGDGMFYGLPNPVDGDATGPYNVKDWRIARLLGGGIYSLPLAKPTGPALLIRALAGIQKTKTANPEISFPWAFSYEADAGIKWPLSGKRIALVGYAGYNGCKPAQNFVFIFSTSAGTSTMTQKTTFPTGTIHARAGIEVQL